MFQLKIQDVQLLTKSILQFYCHPLAHTMTTAYMINTDKFLYNNFLGLVYLKTDIQLKFPVSQNILESPPKNFLSNVHGVRTSTPNCLRRQFSTTFILNTSIYQSRKPYAFKNFVLSCSPKILYRIRCISLPYNRLTRGDPRIAIRASYLVVGHTEFLCLFTGLSL